MSGLNWDRDRRRRLSQESRAEIAREQEEQRFHREAVASAATTKPARAKAPVATRALLNASSLSEALCPHCRVVVSRKNLITHMNKRCPGRAQTDLTPGTSKPAQVMPPRPSGRHLGMAHLQIALEELDLSAQMAKSVLERLFDPRTGVITNAIRQGGSVDIPGLGRLSKDKAGLVRPSQGKGSTP